jgi:hypothetical protein
LHLDRLVAPQPRWPDAENAHLYLKKYFRRGPGKWAYDGFIAYFLHLLRPSDAYVTDVAKCYFKPQSEEVFDTCVDAHLAREVQLFEANLVVSFASKLTAKRVERLPIEESSVLKFYHPAAHKSVREKEQRVVSELAAKRKPPVSGKLSPPPRSGVRAFFSGSEIWKFL